MVASIVQSHIPRTVFLPCPRFTSIFRIQNVINRRFNAFSFRETTLIADVRYCVLSYGKGRAKAFTRSESESSDVPDMVLNEKFRFDINLAVVLAGFAFEAYNTPPDTSGVHEMDPFGCKTIFLSETFLQEVYEGQFLITLNKGYKFPGLDLWGTSDPYVVLRIGECVVTSKTMWATTEPVWNESFKINVKNPSTQYLQIAAWDANLVSDNRRLGNSGIDLQPFSDGEKHEVELQLEGMGGGGVISLEVQYQRFEDLAARKKGWSIPLLSDFLQGQKFEDVFNNAIGLPTLTVYDFLRSVLGPSSESSNESISEISTASSQVQNITEGVINNNNTQNLDIKDEKNSNFEPLSYVNEGISKTLGPGIQGLKFPLLDSMHWDALDVIKSLGLDSQNKAESQYIESGLATAPSKKDESSTDLSVSTTTSFLSDEDIKKASISLLKQTEETLKSWTVLSASLIGGQGKSTNKTTAIIQESIPSTSKTDYSRTSDEKLKELEELRKMFGKAESAMEAWAVLATSLGHKSFVKSAFEKLCFLDNNKTDTQVAIWRDAMHQRLVVSFRGTEQVKWKDLRTDLMLLPVSFNPERVGAEFNQEAMIHGGFLSAYDSVRNRLMSLVKAVVGFKKSDASFSDDTHQDIKEPWQIHVTGHSLGGALATLFALELSMSKLARQGQIKITMYNFGSPRVGNKKFAEQYNEIVRDSWRVVNHRDIIPTVPRLMGYCHVAHPIYLTAGDVDNATVNMELIGDGYAGDVIGEATPDFLLEEFMKGEKNLISKLLQTEIAMLRAIRDGSALMQHMEDFYYISLLESVSSRLGNNQERN